MLSLPGLSAPPAMPQQNPPRLLPDRSQDAAEHRSAFLSGRKRTILPRGEMKHDETIPSNSLVILSPAAFAGPEGLAGIR